LKRSIEDLEITPNQTREIGRMADALSQYRRIEEYLPVLRAQAAELEEKLEELQELIADEETALRDLRYEGTHTRGHVAQRRRKMALRYD
jgi:hypothetical protein